MIPLSSLPPPLPTSPTHLPQVLHLRATPMAKKSNKILDILENS